MFTVAIWNLERSVRKSASVRQGQDALIAGLRADLLLVTEVHRTLSFDGLTGHFSASAARSSGYPEVEAAVGIFHRWKAEPVPLPTCEHTNLALCLRFLESPIGPLIVYGSIIPYHRWDVASGARVWQRHQESAARQASDWAALLATKEHDNYRLIVGGDFNQAMDGVGRYGNRRSREILDEALSDRLVCVTRDDFSGSVGRHTVDHLALDERLTHEYSWQAVAWHGRSAKPRLSDHNGVTVTLNGKPGRSPAAT